MKMISKVFIMAALMFFSMHTDAQKIRKTDGDVDVLKSESSINIEFTYDNISVGKFANEKDYIKKKTDEYNSRDPGRGDRWAQEWVDDRSRRYEPDFKDLFMKYSNKTLSKDAKYTLIFKIRSIEPGYNIGISAMYGGRKNAEIDADAWIVETANRSNKIAVITVDNAPGGSWGGYDYDTGSRITESFAISGKKLAKFIY